MKKIFTIVVIIFCISSGLITAQTDSVKAPKPQWWLSSSLADTIEQYLFHIDGQYSYTKMTGAIEGEMHSGGISAVVRKSIFTNHTDYMIDKMNLTLAILRFNYAAESQVFTDYIDADLTGLLYGEGGFIWERDNTLLLKNRYSLYAGVGINGLIYEKHYLKILAALGRINQDYTIPVDNIDVVKGAYAALYIRQHYTYIIDQHLSFMEQAYYLTNINHPDRYRMSVGFNFNISIVQPVSLMLGWTYKYDKEAELLGAVAKNTTQTIGFNISM